MEDLNTNEELNNESASIETLVENISDVNTVADYTENETSPDNTNDTDIIEYKEVEEPCVALTIIGENKLTDAEVFVRRGFRYSIKAFFSAIVLTILNLFI